MPYGEVHYGGVIGELEPESFASLRQRLQDILKEPVRCYQNNEKPVQRAAVAAGDGKAYK